MPDLPLPEGTRLLHIGPHKTGTTSLQASLVAARAELPQHGVVYPGRSKQHAMAARAMTGARGPKGDPRSTPAHWERLLREVQDAGDMRVVVSSESFAMADDEAARDTVAQLGGDRVHVLVTLRPLSKVMPSSWQQYVREGLTSTYGRWLNGMLREPPYDKPTPTFWHRHRHDVLIQRWADIVGPQNLTVVVVDSRNRSMLTDVVSELLGLPQGVLAPDVGRSNRSLTYSEIELVRRLNQEFRRREWSDEMFRDYVRQGMILHLQDTREPGPDEPQIPTPSWALRQAGSLGAEAAEKIATMGVRVVGDLGLLSDGSDDTSAPATIPPVPDLPIDVAGEAVVGILQLCVTDAQSPEPPPGRPVAMTPTRELVAVLGRRLTRRFRRPPRPAPRPAEPD